MELRQKLSQHRSLVAVLAGIAALGSFAWVVYQLVHVLSADPSQMPPRRAMAYFYDQNTGLLFTASADRTGPIETESGLYQGRPAGVRAQVYACRSCDDAKQRFVAWLEIPIDALVATDPEKYARFQTNDLSAGETTSIMIRRPEDKDWMPIDSPQAQQIFSSVAQQCDHGAQIFRCRPPSSPLQ